MRTLLDAGKMLCFAALIGFMLTALTTVFSVDAGPPGKMSIAVEVLQPGDLCAQEVTATAPETEPSGVFGALMEFELWKQVLLGIASTPLAAFLVGKLTSYGRIGWMAGRALKRGLDGNYSNQDKVETMNDIVSVAKGWWPNKSAVG